MAGRKVSTSHAALIAADQKLSDGVQQHLSDAQAQFLAGNNLTRTAILAMLNEQITAQKACGTARANLTECVKHAEQLRAANKVVIDSLKRSIIAMFVHSPAILADFGLQAPKPPTVTTKERAAAIDKAQVTRKARKPGAAATTHQAVPTTPNPVNSGNGSNGTPHT